jgi:hypothetical protein
MSQPKKTMEATRGTTTLGAILVPTTALTTFIVTLTHTYFLYFLCVLQAVSGIVLLIVSAVTRYNSREAMRVTASSILRPYDKGFTGGAYYNQASPWQQQAQYNQPLRPIEPPAVSPAVPSSAFVPVVNEIPYQPAAAPRKTRVVPPAIDTPATAAPGRGASGGPKEYCGMCGAEMPNISDLKFCPGCGSPRE